MDLSAENVLTVFNDCLARPAATPNLRVRGVHDEFFFNLVQLKSHIEVVRGFLGRLSTRFYIDRGGGHSVAAMGLRRDGEQWGGRPDVERLVTLGLGLGLVQFCLDRSRWHLFPGGVPFVRLPGDLYQLWATFRLPPQRAPGEATRSVVQPFRAEDHPPPPGVPEGHWYRSAAFSIGDLGDATHVAVSFYNRIIVDGFFSNTHLPSWVLDSDTRLEIY